VTSIAAHPGQINDARAMAKSLAGILKIDSKELIKKL
jgi:hypothetical protein